MSIGPSSDLHSFYHFLGLHLEGEPIGLSPEESVRAFRTYQEELSQLRSELKPALARLDRGEGKEIDFDTLEKEIVERLAKEGITR